MSDDLLMQLLAQRAERRPGRAAQVANLVGWVLAIAMFVLVVLAVAPDVLVSYGLVAPERMSSILHLATPAPEDRITGENRQSTENGYSQQPIGAPLPDCATVHDTTTACVRTEEEPTPTALPAPTSTAAGFWSAEELAAFTATAEAFYDPATLPTAPPAFVQAVQDGCNDGAKLEQSALLRILCAGVATEEAAQ